MAEMRRKSESERSRRIRRARLRGGALLVALLAAGLLIVQTQSSLTPAVEAQVSKAVAKVRHEDGIPLKDLVTGRAMAVGSSVAMGWDDKVGGGYLKRAFVSYSGFTGHPYTLVNKAQEGDVAAQVDGQYHLWVQAYRPQIVVISWGALDDIHAKTPLPTFRATVAHQIALALSDHEVVLIVTPPVTKASYTEDLKSEPLYLDSEMDVARAFHNPNVYVFDVFDQMKQYLTAHHQTYVPYMADGWHPNTLGHALGGQLMFDDMKAAFGKGPIAFK